MLATWDVISYPTAPVPSVMSSTLAFESFLNLSRAVCRSVSAIEPSTIAVEIPCAARKEPARWMVFFQQEKTMLWIAKRQHARRVESWGEATFSLLDER